MKQKLLIYLAFMFLAIPGIFAQTFSETPATEFIANSCTVDNEFPVTVTGVGILTPTNALASVSVDIFHPNNEDLDISLRSPAGTVIELSTDNGGTSDNYTGTNFEDAGVDGPITSGTGPFTGSYIPEQPLATFVGEDADGDWVLQVCDDNATGTLNSLTGTLNSFSLTFGIPCVVADASISTPMFTCPATDVSIDVVIADLGSAAALVISNSANATVVPAPTATTYTLTGFMLGDGTVTITLADAADPACATTFDFEIPAACPPDNDLRDNAEPIACGDTDVAGTTANATDSTSEACGDAGDGDLGGVWYTFTGDGTTATVTVNSDPGTTNDLNDSQLAVYSGDAINIVCVGSNDDSDPPGSNGSQLTFLSEIGTNYYIYVDGWSSNSGAFLISLACCTENQVTFTNEDATSSVNVLSLDPTSGVETWLGVNIPPGDSWVGSGNEGDELIFRDGATNVEVDSYTFGPLTCAGVYDVEAFTELLPCDPGQGGFQSHSGVNGNNTGDYLRTTMYNGPFNNEEFDNHIDDMIGVTGNRVHMIDPNGQISTYILTTGKYRTTYTPTEFTGGDAAGPIASANILGVSGVTVHVLGADGTIDSYNTITGAVSKDNTATTLINGPMMGMPFTSLDIVGSKGKFTVIILQADGSLIEYTIGGRFRGDLTATDLSDGVFDGSTFAGESNRIVGTNQNNVFLVSECNAAPVIVRSEPSNNIEIKSAPTASFDEVTFKAFPNPLSNNGILTINVQNMDVPVQSTITLMDAVGKVWNVRDIDDLQNGNFEINMAEVPNGLYFVNIQSGAELKTLKIVK